MAPMIPSVSQSGQSSFTWAGVSTSTVDADRVRHALVVHELVPAVPGAGEADVRHLLEAHGLAGLLLQALVEIHRVLVNLPDRVAHVEQRQQTGGVPGGAGGELLALDENHVAPALPGEVVQGPHPDDAAPDDDHPSLRFHERAILLLCCPVGGRHPLWLARTVAVLGRGV
jgi:hypothetical protein